MTPEQRRELLSREMEQSTGMSQRERELFNQCENLKAERDALQAELSSLKADMFVLNNDMGYTTGVLEDVLKQRDALQARLDGAVDLFTLDFDKRSSVKLAIEILTGEGEWVIEIDRKNSQYRKSFIENVKLDFEHKGGQGFGGFDLPMIASIDGLSVRVERSGCVRNQLQQRKIALEGLYAAWKEVKEIEGK